MSSICKFFSSSKPKKGKLDSNEIEKRMKMEKEKQKRLIRILLLGPGNSGKTTILKQMKKIHNIYSENDSKMMSGYIQDAVVGYMKILCYQSAILNKEHDQKTLVSPELEQTRLEMLKIQSPYKLTQDVLTNIKILWDDKGIKETLRLRQYYQIHDNVGYFFNRIDPISDEYYIPSFDDYLRIRLRSTGFAQTKLAADISKFGRYTFEFTDVGGQRSERSKWMRFISEDIHAVLYIVAISDYDLKLFEDNKTNRLVEAINLFKQIMLKGKFFTNKSVLLFFNKYDLFKEKIKTIPITVAFKDFPVKDMDAHNEDDVVRFIAGKFLQVFQDEKVNLGGPLHILRTTALDTDHVDNIFKDITLDLVKQNLRTYGIL